MRDWNLTAGPRGLTLAADARHCSPNYLDDHIWELSLRGGEPPALALQTTFGLRARSFRLFPRFSEAEVTRSDPAEFSIQPAIRHFYPNLAVVTYAPFPGIEMAGEYWVPQSEAAAGRLRITNRSSAARQIRLEWVALLMAGEDGHPMTPTEISAAPALWGATGGLAPVVFLSGGAVAAGGPYPALTIVLDLPPGSTRQLIWAQVALSSHEMSFELARKIAARNWEAERARVELLNNSQVEISTGDPDWDFAFALSQKIALGLFLGPTDHLPAASFVNVRGPDQGYSLRGDGSDYGYLWNGQGPLEAYILAGLVLPAAPQLVKGLLENFLAAREGPGLIDWKPGLGGQRGNRLAPPLLASLAWRIYQASDDLAFLEEVFPHLQDFLHSWFSPEHDRDGDGIPEWDDPMQAGFDDHPIFARWQPWALGVDITTAESPALCAFLFRECQTLIRIARLLNRLEPIPALQALSENLRTAVEIAWNERTASYHYWDRDTHYTTPGQALGERMGPGEIRIDREFSRPTRLLFRIQPEGEASRRPHVFVHGISPSGSHRVERITAERFQWYLGLGTASSERTYSTIEHIEVLGLDPADSVGVQSAGLTGEDHTLLSPLWAGIPSAERAEALVIQTITAPDRYWRPFGIPACPGLNQTAQSACQSVHPPWNILIGEGLVAYGYREEAAELVSRIMAASVKCLELEGSFHRSYDPESGQGIGERDALAGLPPLGLFLETLGIRLISPQKVGLEGSNPFPWPVTVKYRGLTVLRQKGKTLVIFPDGQTTTVNDPAACIVSNE